MTEKSEAAVAGKQTSGRPVVKLSRPLETHQGPINELTLREPVFGDYLRHGEIHKAERTKDGGLALSVDREALIGWAATLTGLDAISLEALPMRDVNALSEVLIPMVTAEGN
ncbi:hypothetical protein A7A08_01847 [Methyloligella halotolerans]|uniref:Phage tail protein E n=1 Tax=Methyloligella halotolerans TaxID=1177755 RepID=A0A1E2RY06_9HYPH|nr:phage tail assembly protein [Methyloligella halotolerans]ODA67101.1 hypothetical protein A7A08_01847 [Methyloligella halotolerans]